MIKSSVLHSNTFLRWISAYLLIGLVFLSSFLALRFGSTHTVADTPDRGDVMQIFFADQPNFVLLENTSSSDTWIRSIGGLEPILGSLTLFSKNEKTSQQYFSQLKKNYLTGSQLIEPGLLPSEIIYPFHSHW
ncbi:hypothetical protein [Owenweeksia hongkongensis]|uniref:hypothetical protein n=1 Tax=Owenweeksia hongkongensis TaxID=253245 RepID=UPI003A95C9B5